MKQCLFDLGFGHFGCLAYQHKGFESMQISLKPFYTELIFARPELSFARPDLYIGNSKA